MYTIWGETQAKETIAKGFHNVTTASHGGMVLSKTFAEKNLSKEALNRATDFKNNYYYYEEDCDKSIVIFELLDKFDLYTKCFSHLKDRDELYSLTIESLNRYSPDYLIEQGVSACPKAYKKFINKKLEQEMRDNKDPDLIVSASNFVFSSYKVTKVITADRKEYLVNSQEYGTLWKECFNTGEPLRLSKIKSINVEKVI